MNTITKVALAMLIGSTATFTAGCDEVEDSSVEGRNGELAFIVDGVRHEADEAQDLREQTLHYFLDADAQAEGVIYAFSSRDDLEDFITEREPAILAQESDQLTFRAPLTFSKFYDWVDYDELFGKLKKGQSISNLAGHPDYNDNDISSVKCRANAYTYLWDLSGFGGSGFVCRNINIDDLDDYGWNARASSLEVTP